MVEATGFKHIIRIAHTDVDGNKPLVLALTQIRGISHRVSRALLRTLGLPESKKAGELTDEEEELLRDAIENRIAELLPPWMLNKRKEFYSGEDRHYVGPDLALVHREDVERLKRIKCYRGIRHARGLKVRGQRTRSNGRRGLAVGVSRRRK
jgi:small subunit ribosomal protein S13